MDTNQTVPQDTDPVEMPTLPLFGFNPAQLAILEAHIQDATRKLLTIRFQGSPDDINNQLRAHAYEHGRLDAFMAIITYDQNRMRAQAEKAQEQQAQQSAMNQ